MLQGIYTNNSVSKEKYDCTLIYNEKYREYNSIYSFSLAQDFFNDCYVIDADVVLNRNIFLTKPSHSKYFTVIRSKTHNEWLPILNSNGQVMRIEIGSLNQPSLSGVSYWTTQGLQYHSNFAQRIHK